MSSLNPRATARSSCSTILIKRDTQGLGPCRRLTEQVQHTHSPQDASRNAAFVKASVCAVTTELTVKHQYDRQPPEAAAEMHAQQNRTLHTNKPQRCGLANNGQSGHGGTLSDGGGVEASRHHTYSWCGGKAYKLLLSAEQLAAEPAQTML